MQSQGRRGEAGYVQSVSKNILRLALIVSAVVLLCLSPRLAENTIENKHSKFPLRPFPLIKLPSLWLIIGPGRDLVSAPLSISADCTVHVEACYTITNTRQLTFTSTLGTWWLLSFNEAGEGRAACIQGWEWPNRDGLCFNKCPYSPAGSELMKQDQLAVDHGLPITHILHGLKEEAGHS